MPVIDGIYEEIETRMQLKVHTDEYGGKIGTYIATGKIIVITEEIAKRFQLIKSAEETSKPFATIDDRLENVASNEFERQKAKIFAQQNNVEKGKVFLSSCLEFSDFEDFTEASHYTDGANDCGIDVWHISDRDIEEVEAKRFVRLIQGKLGSNSPASALRDDLEKVNQLFKKIVNCNQIFNDLGNEGVQRFARELFNFLTHKETTRNDEIVYNFFTLEHQIYLNNPIPNSDAYWISQLEKQINLSVRELFRMGDGRGNVRTFPNFRVEPRCLSSCIVRKYFFDTHYLELTGSFNSTNNDPLETPSSLVGFAGLQSIINLKEQLEKADVEESELFEENVRGFLKKSSTNKAVQETLEDQPGLFGIYNNGIVITAEDILFERNASKVRLKQPSVVNGCQTVNSIWTVYTKKKLELEPADFLTWCNNTFFEGFVSVKIICPRKISTQANIETDFLKNTIVLAANSQNGIKQTDFYCLQDYLPRLQAYALTKGVYVKLKRGIVSERHLDRDLLNQAPWNDDIQINEVLRVLYTLLFHDPSDALSLKNKFAPGRSNYNKLIFRKKPFSNALIIDDEYSLTGNEIVIASHAYLIARGKKYHLRLRGTAAQNDNRGPTSFLIHYIASKLMMHVFGVTLAAETDRKWLEDNLMIRGEKMLPFLNTIYEHADIIRMKYMTSPNSGIMNEPNATDYQQGITALLKRKMQDPSIAPVLHHNIQVYIGDNLTTLQNLRTSDFAIGGLQTATAQR